MENTGKRSPDRWPPNMVVCVGMVVLKGEKALFVRQAKGHSLEGEWSIPWGLVDDGEAPENAAIRETREESGITAEMDGLLGIQNLPKPGWLGIIFLGHHVDGEPTPDGVEADKAAYLSLEEMNDSKDRFEPWCEWIVRRVLTGKHTVTPCTKDNPYSPRRSFL